MVTYAIETVLTFALGFLVAGLLTRLFLPALWRQAMRLSTCRLELRMPLSMAKIAAERNQLQAEFAVERRKLEQSSEKLAERMALARAEFGPRAKRILGFDDDLPQSREDGGRAEEKVRILERTLNEVDLERGAIEKGLYHTSGMLERRLDELRDLSALHTTPQNLDDERRMRMAEKIALAQFLEHERDQSQDDLLASRARREQLRENLAEAQRNAERLRGEIAARIEAGFKAGQEAAVLRDTQRTQQAELQGALESTWRENQMLRTELGQLRARLSQDPASAADRLAARAVGLDAPTAREASGDDMALLRKPIADLVPDVFRVVASPGGNTSGQMHDPVARTSSADRGN